MAGEVQFKYKTSATTYFRTWNRNSLIFNTSGTSGAFTNYDASVYESYKRSATEKGSCGHYAGDFPTTIAPGIYSIEALEQLGANPAESDPIIAVGDLEWNGTTVLPLSDLTTSGQLSLLTSQPITRGVMIEDFTFKLVSSADHITPFTSGIVSGQVSKDGSTFGALQSGVFTEVGLGFYKVTLTSGDMSFNAGALAFTATGVSGGTADQRDFSIITQHSSGY